jgi:hypothetical protein
MPVTTTRHRYRHTVKRFGAGVLRGYSWLGRGDCRHVWTDGRTSRPLSRSSDVSQTLRTGKGSRVIIDNRYGKFNVTRHDDDTVM